MKHSKLPTLAIDEERHIEGIQDEIQPGVYVRRVDGEKEVTDEGLLAF